MSSLIVQLNNRERKTLLAVGLGHARDGVNDMGVHRSDINADANERFRPNAPEVPRAVRLMFHQVNHQAARADRGIRAPWAASTRQMAAR